VQSWLDHINSHKEIFLWQVFTAYSPLIQGLRVFNLNHGISLLRKKEDDVYQVFHFATTNDNEQILDFYLKNISFLNVFADYFVDKISDIIDHQTPGKLIQLEGFQHPKEKKLIKPTAISPR